MQFPVCFTTELWFSVVQIHEYAITAVRTGSAGHYEHKPLFVANIYKSTRRNPLPNEVSDLLNILYERKHRSAVLVCSEYSKYLLYYPLFLLFIGSKSGYECHVVFTVWFEFRSENTLDTGFYSIGLNMRLCLPCRFHVSRPNVMKELLTKFGIGVQN